MWANCGWGTMEQRTWGISKGMTQVFGIDKDQTKAGSYG